MTKQKTRSLGSVRVSPALIMEIDAFCEEHNIENKSEWLRSVIVEHIVSTYACELEIESSLSALIRQTINGGWTRVSQVERIKSHFSKDLQKMLIFSLEDNLVRLKPRYQLEQDTFIEIARIVKHLNGTYISVEYNITHQIPNFPTTEKNGHFVIPLEKFDGLARIWIDMIDKGMISPTDANKQLWKICVSNYKSDFRQVDALRKYVIRVY